MAKNESLPTIDKTETGANIKRYMRMKRLSIPQLQEELGMLSPILIYTWCRGEHLPSTEYLLKMSTIFGCTIEDILVIQEGK